MRIVIIDDDGNKSEYVTEATETHYALLEASCALEIMPDVDRDAAPEWFDRRLKEALELKKAHYDSRRSHEAFKCDYPIPHVHCRTCQSCTPLVEAM